MESENQQLCALKSNIGGTLKKNLVNLFKNDNNKCRRTNTMTKMDITNLDSVNSGLQTCIGKQNKHIGIITKFKVQFSQNIQERGEVLHK